MTHARLRLGITAVLLAAVPACAAEQPGAGPLVVGGQSGDLCLPTPPSPDYTFGLHALPLTGDRPVTLTGVSLVAAEAVQIKDAYLVPVGQSLIGTSRGWPPPAERLDPEGALWGRRVPANGATITPGADHTSNLVLHLLVSGDGGFDAVRVTYASENDNYQADTTIKVRFAAKCF